MEKIIKECVQKIDIYKKGLFKDSGLLKEIVGIYSGLNIKQKKDIDEYMYNIYRGEFDFLFCSSDYHGSLKWIRKVMEHTRYQREPTDNKFHIIIHAIKSFLIEYLETDNKIYFDKAYQEYCHLDDFDKYLKNDDVYKEIVAMIESINNSTIYTEVSLILPLVLKEPQKIICVEFGGIIAEVYYKYFNRNNTIISTKNIVEKQFDKEASSGYTKWNIKFHNYYSDIKNLYSGSPKILYIDYLICKCVNVVIDQYRIKDNCYWVKNVYPVMLQQKSIKYKAGEIVFRDIPYYDSSQYEIHLIHGKIEYNDIIHDDIPIYKLLLLESKSFWVSGNFRESVLSLNTALENYIYEVICPYIVEQSKGELFPNFYRQNVPGYDDYSLKEYISEESFLKAVKEKKIVGKDLTTFGIFKMLYKYDSNIKTKIEKKRLNKLINSIRGNRNDFIHGNLKEVEASYDGVHEQISDFERLIDIVTKVIN